VSEAGLFDRALRLRRTKARQNNPLQVGSGGVVRSQYSRPAVSRHREQCSRDGLSKFGASGFSLRRFARARAAQEPKRLTQSLDTSARGWIISKSSRKIEAQQVRGRAKASKTGAHSIQSGPLRRITVRIFDNQVEHASRENTDRSGLIILTMLVLRRLFEPCEADSFRRPPSTDGIIRFQTRV
jgi:hypothetical protein